MQPDRQADLESGKQLIQEIGEVMPENASDRIQRLYDSTRQTLRVPFVNFIFRVLANRPDYLESVWWGVRPRLVTLAFERSADALRALAPLEDARMSPVPNWGALGDLSRIRPFTDSIHYVLPKLLLIATAWDEAVAPGSKPVQELETDASEERFPEGVAEGTESIKLLNPTQTEDRVRALFADIREEHGHPGVASYYRALGHWPDFLEAAWQCVKPLINRPAYQRRKEMLIEEARLAAQSLPLYGIPVHDLAQAAEIRKILAVFRFQLLPDLLIDVTTVKCLLEGPNLARQSRLSVARPSR